MQARVEHFMRQALALAKQGEGKTLPNPCVGAVVVLNGKVIGRGYHKRAGTAHAEIMALKQAGSRARGAVLYCTLEPCEHWGRTGPCVEAIIRAGIRRVFVGMRDPNPLVRGKGIRMLRRAGIDVRVGLLKKEAEALNRSYVFALRRHRPMVTAKVAQSFDGKTATRTGESRWITDAASRRHAHRVRGSFDAIMVGIGTVLADDPRLEAVPARKVWTKIIVDSRGRIPSKARLLKTAGRVVVATASMSRKKEALLRRSGVKVARCPGPGGRVDLACLLSFLHGLEVRHALIEGGAHLVGSFFDACLVDQAVFYMAPMVIGGAQALPAVAGRGVGRLVDAPRLKNISCQRLKNDLFVVGDIIYPTVSK